MPTTKTKTKRPVSCPNPEKNKLATRGEAIRQALLRSAASGKSMAYYPCPAGHFHITSHTPNWSTAR
jgi:hypothetical protein